MTKVKVIFPDLLELSLMLLTAKHGHAGGAYHSKAARDKAIKEPFVMD